MPDQRSGTALLLRRPLATADLLGTLLGRTRRAVNLEQLIQRHRPAPADEGKPAGEAQLLQLNRYGLIGRAFQRQLERDATDPNPWNQTVIRKITAWETLADAQRQGLRVTPLNDRK